MKKLITLVLALALVFAIAAPAMAAIGFPAPAESSPTYEDFSVKIIQLDYDDTQAFSGYYKAPGGVYYAYYNTKFGVVRGTPVRFAVEVTIPAAEDIKGYKDFEYDFSNLALSLTLENIKLVTGEDDTAANALTSSAWDANAKGTVYTYKGTDLAIKPDVDGVDEKATTLWYMFTGTIIESGKKGTATVEMTAGQDEDDLTSGIKFTRNNTLFTVATTNDKVTVTNPDGQGLVFTRNSKGQITFIKTTGVGTSADYEVNIKKGVISFRNGEVTITEGVAVHTAVVQQIFSALGFSWTTDYDLMYFTDANAVSLAAQMSKSATATWNPYTANLTVTDGTNVPNTGDNMSVIGFVMVGLALLATAAVVVKKVRA